MTQHICQHSNHWPLVRPHHRATWIPVSDVVSGCVSKSPSWQTPSQPRPWCNKTHWSQSVSCPTGIQSAANHIWPTELYSCPATVNFRYMALALLCHTLNDTTWDQIISSFLWQTIQKTPTQRWESRGFLEMIELLCTDSKFKLNLILNG